MWDEITYQTSVVQANAAVEVWEWISNVISQIIGHGITYPYRVLKLI